MDSEIAMDEFFEESNRRRQEWEKDNCQSWPVMSDVIQTASSLSLAADRLTSRKGEIRWSLP